MGWWPRAWASAPVASAPPPVVRRTTQKQWGRAIDGAVALLHLPCTLQFAERGSGAVGVAHRRYALSIGQGSWRVWRGGYA